MVGSSFWLISMSGCCPANRARALANSCSAILSPVNSELTCRYTNSAVPPTTDNPRMPRMMTAAMRIETQVWRLPLAIAGARLFGPDQQPIASLGDVQHEAWSMALEIFERQALSLPAFFRDAQVREADPAASRNGPHEPAGKVDTRQSAFLTIIAKRMQGPERRPRPRRLAAQNGLTVRCQLDEWSLSLEPRPRLRELGKCGLALHRFGVHVRPHEHVCGAHERGHDQSGDDCCRDDDGDPRLLHFSRRLASSANARSLSPSHNVTAARNSSFA